MNRGVERTQVCLPCPKCGMNGETMMLARYLPSAVNPMADKDVVQARCIVRKHDCEFKCNVAQEFDVFGVDETTDDEALDALMKEICISFYGYVKDRWTKGEQNEDSKF